MIRVDRWNQKNSPRLATLEEDKLKVNGRFNEIEASDLARECQGLGRCSSVSSAAGGGEG